MDINTGKGFKTRNYVIVKFFVFCNYLYT